MSEINITNKKTLFKPKFSSNPPDGTVTYICPEFFNVTGGSLTYTGGTLEGDTEIYAKENTVSDARGGVFSLTATTNPSLDYSGTITVTCAWTVTQEGAPEPALELSADSPIEAAATLITYYIESNVGCTVKYKDQTDIFPEGTGTGATGEFEISPNTSPEPIEHVISAFCTDYPEVSATTVITQARAYAFDVQPTMIDFPSGTSSTTLTVTTNTSWSASSNQSWCTLSDTGGSGDATITVNATKNEAGARNAIITFNVEGVGTRTVRVNQQSAPTYSYTLYHYGVLGDDSSCYSSGYEVKEGDDEITFNNGFEQIDCSLSGYHSLHEFEDDCTIVMRGGSHSAETYTVYSSAVSLNDGKIEFNGAIQTLDDCIGGGGYGGVRWFLRIRIYDHGYRGSDSYLKSQAYSEYVGSSSSSLQLLNQTKLSGTIEPGSYDVEIVLTRDQDN